MAINLKKILVKPSVLVKPLKTHRLRNAFKNLAKAAVLMTSSLFFTYHRSPSNPEKILECRIWIWNKLEVDLYAVYRVASFRTKIFFQCFGSQRFVSDSTQDPAASKFWIRIRIQIRIRIRIQPKNNFYLHQLHYLNKM
jgi:hypothetical protein